MLLLTALELDFLAASAAERQIGRLVTVEDGENPIEPMQFAHHHVASAVVVEMRSEERRAPSEPVDILIFDALHVVAQRLMAARARMPVSVAIDP